MSCCLSAISTVATAWALYAYSDDVAPIVAPFIYAIYGGMA